MTFSLMNQTPEKVDMIARTFLNDFPYLADEDRTPEKVWLLMNKYFRIPGHIFYECGDGVLLFRDVIPGHKATAVWIQFNRMAPTHGTFRDAGRLMREFMDIYDLNRLEAETADWKVARLLERLGFTKEGVRVMSFMFKGVLYDHHFLALRRF